MTHKKTQFTILVTLLMTASALTWGTYNCPGLYIGTTLGAHNVVDKGLLDPIWKSRMRKVVRRDSEFFYITSMQHPIKVSLRSI